LFFFSEIGNFNISGPVNQLIKKKALQSSVYLYMYFQYIFWGGGGYQV
jgi:hypothetical protein